jgi:hypothetical protein
MDFEIRVDVAATPRIVWDVMSDVERWHEWTASVRGIRKLDDGPIRPGTRMLIRQPRFPPALWVVEDVQPERGFRSRSGAPGLRVRAYHTIEPAGPGSRVTLGLDYSGTLGRWMAKLTRGITERYLAMEAEGLKKRSEERAREGPSTK